MLYNRYRVIVLLCLFHPYLVSVHFLRPYIFTIFRENFLLLVIITIIEVFFDQRCNIPMAERPRRDISEGYSWWCRQCKKRKSIQHGSFFSKSKMTLQKWLLMLHLWALDCPVTDAMDQVEIDSRTAVDIHQWLREICTTKLLQAPIILGGLVQSYRSTNLCFVINLRYWVKQ